MSHSRGRKRGRDGSPIPHSAGVALDEAQQRALNEKRDETLVELIDEQQANVVSRIQTFFVLMKFSSHDIAHCGGNELLNNSRRFACTVARVWQKGWSTLKQCGRDCCHGFCACIYDARLMVARNQAKSLSECFAQMVKCLGRYVDSLGISNRQERQNQTYELLRKFLDASWDPPKQRAASTRLVCKNATRYDPFRSALGDVLEHDIPEGKQVGYVLDLMSGKATVDDMMTAVRPRKRRRVKPELITESNLPPLENDCEMKLSVDWPPRTVPVLPPLPLASPFDSNVSLDAPNGIRSLPPLPSTSAQRPVVVQRQAVQSPFQMMTELHPSSSASPVRFVQSTIPTTRYGQTHAQIPPPNFFPFRPIDQHPHALRPVMIPIANCLKLDHPCPNCRGKDVQIKVMVARIQELEEEQRRIRSGAAALLQMGSAASE